jgi:hypothetical protein
MQHGALRVQRRPFQQGLRLMSGQDRRRGIALAEYIKSKPSAVCERKRKSEPVQIIEDDAWPARPASTTARSFVRCGLELYAIRRTICRNCVFIGGPIAADQTSIRAGCNLVELSNLQFQRIKDKKLSAARASALLQEDGFTAFRANKTSHGQALSSRPNRLRAIRDLSRSS